MTIQPADGFYKIANVVQKGATAVVVERSEPADMREHPDSRMIGFRDAWRFVRRRLPLLIAVSVLGTILTALALWILPASYTAEAEVVLDRNDAQPFQVVDREERDRSGAETELDIIGSRYIAGRVIDKLQLTLSNPEPGASLDSQRDTLINNLIANLKVTRTGDSLAIQVTMSNPDPKLAAAMTNAFAKEYVAASVEAKRPDDAEKRSIARSQDQTLLAKLRDDEATAVRGRASLASKLGANHPRIVDADAAIASARAMIDAETKRLLSQQTDEAGRPGARVISLADVPAVPSFPKPKIIMASGIAASMVLAALIAILVEGIDTRIWTRERAARAAGVTNVLYVPSMVIARSKHTGTPLEYLRLRAHSAFSEAIRSIYLRCCMAVGETRRQVILVTSCVPREGKTTIAVGLAVTAAAEGWQTVLVDLDLHCAAVSDAAEVRGNGYSVQDVLNGECDVSQVAVQHPEFPTLHVIPAAPQDQVGWHSRNLHSLIATLCQKYDVVILDSPPSLIVSDALWLAPLADTTLLVTRWGVTEEGDVRTAAANLRAAGATSISCIVNNVDLKSHARRAEDTSLNHLRHAKRYVSG